MDTRDTLRLSRLAKWKRNYTNIPISNKPLMLNLGDSFTYGEGVSENQTFSFYLQEKLPTLQVINGGVAGGGLREMFDVYAYFSRYNLDVVFLTWLDIDLLRVRLSKTTTFPPQHILHSWDDREDHTDYEKSLAYNLHWLQEIIKGCAVGRTTFVLALWPRNIFRAKTSRLSRKLAVLAAEYHVTFIDDYHKYLALYKNQELIVSWKNWHPSVLAHRLIAARLTPFFVDQLEVAV